MPTLLKPASGRRIRRRRSIKAGDDLPRTLAALADLTHRRWAVPILAELHRDRRAGGAKFITLAHRLDLSRQSLRDTLDLLIEQDLVMPNPGYGHPMRPEYMLTDDGHLVAPAAAALMRLLRARGLEDVALRKWSLPVLAALDAGLERFSQLKAALPGITSRALTLALKDLMQARLISRRVTSGYPPSTAYRPTVAAAAIVPLLAPLRADVTATS